MNFKQTQIPGVIVIDPAPHADDRGHFFRAWCSREFADHGIDFVPLQANMGFSLRKGTVRGMHFQVSPALEVKLVRCTRGAIYDVAADLRPGSPSYGQWHGEVLSADNGRMLLVPEHCAHGYQTLEDNTEMHYMTSQFYAPDAARGARFDDPRLNISWPVELSTISQQDCGWPLLA